MKIDEGRNLPVLWEAFPLFAKPALFFQFPLPIPGAFAQLLDKLRSRPPRHWGGPGCRRRLVLAWEIGRSGGFANIGHGRVA